MASKPENFELSNEYKKSWNYLKDSKNFIWAVIGIFVASALTAVLFPTPENISQQISQFMEEIVEKTEGMSATELSGFIFLNNLQSSFLGIALGIIFGIFPLISTISNGYIVGFVSGLSVNENGILSLWRLLPHGIFELPAVFISFALGIRLGRPLFLILTEPYEYYFKKINSSKWNILILALLVLLTLLLVVPYIVFLPFALIFDRGLRKAMKSQMEKSKKEMNSIIGPSGKTFILIVVPLLVIAAIIEGILIALSS